MRTDDFRPSGNVEDDREASASRGGMSVGAGGLGIGTVIVIGLISWYLGIDPSPCSSTVVGYLRVHRGQRFASTTAVDPSLLQPRYGRG
jgi:uncharacterized protein